MGSGSPVSEMLVRDFDFDLPPELIAQEPVAERGTARLLCLDRVSGEVQHRVVADLPELLHAVMSWSSTTRACFRRASWAAAYRAAARSSVC